LKDSSPAKKPLTLAGRKRIKSGAHTLMKDIESGVGEIGNVTCQSALCNRQEVLQNDLYALAGSVFTQNPISRVSRHNRVDRWCGYQT